MKITFEEIENKDPFYGALEAPQETNYTLAGGVTVLPKPRFVFEDNEIQYNQTKVSGVSCTVFGSMGAVSDQTAYKFTLEQQKEAWNIALSKGAQSWGWYVDQAVDVVRNLYNNLFPNDQLMSFEIKMKSEALFEALDLGYSVVTGYRGNKAYNTDKLDGVLDEVTFGTSTFGHCVRSIVKRKDGFYYIVDNYYTNTNKNNVYRIASKENLKKLIYYNVFFQNGYIFVNKKDFDNANNLKDVFGNAPIWGHSTIQKCVDKGIKTYWDDWSVAFGDSKLEDALFNLKLLTKKEGFVSNLRFYMAMDNLGQLDNLPDLPK